MSGSAFALTGSRLQNATRVNQAAEDADVTDWAKASDFIVCAMIETTAHGGTSGTIQLRWRNVTDSGSFAALSASGELTWSGTTNLVNGNAVASGEEVCTPTSGTTRIDGVEREGANDVSTTHGQDEFCEHQWAIDSSGGLDGKQYEFEVYDATAGAAVGTCLADLTTASVSFNIDASVDALILTENAATVNAETNVLAAVDALALTEQPATVNAETNIQASTDTLTVTGLAASVSLGLVVAASVAALTLTALPATVNAETNVNAGVDALTLTGQAATVNAETNVLAGVDALTLTGLQAGVSLGVVVQASTAALVLTENPATVNAETNVQASVDALALTEFAATVNAETNVLANVDALAITEFAATVSLGADTNIAASVDALTLTTLTATVNAATNIQAATNALTLTANAAGVNAATNIAASADSLILTEYQASIVLVAGHRAETIMDAIITAVTGLTTTGANVYRGRAYPVEVSKLPALVVWQGEDSTQTELLGDEVISLLNVHIDAVAREPANQIDTTLNLIREEVTVAIMADYTLGLAYVDGIMEQDSEEPEIVSDGDAPAAQMRMNWNVTYQHSRTDPAV